MMRVGFAAIYSFRPHVEHLYFLATLARKAGHDTFFLTCDGDLSDCYVRELRGRSAWRECLQCRVGGIRSFSGSNVASIGNLAASTEVSADASPEWALSSASTLGRFESDADYSGQEFAKIASRLFPAVKLSYQAARAWIHSNNLDAVCIFNARMDVTRAIYEAAKSLGVRVVSVERTWFGDGLQLLPDENCLGLRSVDELVEAFRDRPLTKEQALRAASHIAGRFLRRNVKEWRAYNLGAKLTRWPVANCRRRILLIPGSRNEVWGHPDWISGWNQPTEAYEALMRHLALEPQDVILRCHPNWGERIGKQDGAFSERYYTEWAARTGVVCIPSVDTTSTIGLIEQCDAIIVASGSAALEAGILGKQVIGIAPAIYQEAGFRDSVGAPEQLHSVRLHVELEQEQRDQIAKHISRQTLRFCYTMVYRIAQYTNFVKADTTVNYRYDFGADPDRLSRLLSSGRLEADDATFTTSPEGEDEVLDLVFSKQWSSLCGQPDVLGRRYTNLQRRPLLRFVDWTAKWKPIGDR
jgi:hypothetical protein